MFFICFFLLIIYSYFIIKKYNNVKTDVEKVIYIMIFLLIIVPFIIYFLDRYNIPSMMGYTQNTNSELWLEILINCCVAITTTFINAAFLIEVTHKQIKSSFDDNKNLNLENQRLQNVPLLTYRFDNNLVEKNMLNMHILCLSESSIEEKENYFLGFNISIENIGLNSVRKIYVAIESDKLKNACFVQFLEDSSLKVGQLKSADFHGFYVKKGTYEFKISVYYQDIMKNWYVQVINLELNVIPDNLLNSTKIIGYKVYDEKQIFYDPMEINDR